MRREVARLVAQAVDLEGPSEPRKHHLVPVSYLERWCSAGRIRATDVVNRNTFVTKPGKVARETDFYRVESADLDRRVVPPLLFEKILSIVEASAVRSFDRAISMGPNPLGFGDALNLATFVAFQLTRGHRFRARVQAIVQQGFVERYRHVSVDGMRNHLGGTPSDEELAQAMEFADGLRTGDVHVEAQQAQVVWMVGEFAQATVPDLMTRAWHVVDTAVELITTDEPVLLLGGPGWPRGQLPGVGTAPVIAMPLSPRRLLVMVSPDVSNASDFSTALTTVETEEVNLELLATAHRWQFSTPRRGGRLPALPPPVTPSLLERGIAIANQPDGELLHAFSPSRWLYAGDVAWPVTRWWRHVPAGRNAFPSPWMAGATVSIRED